VLLLLYGSVDSVRICRC